MSHIVKIATKVHDPVAVAAACTRLGLSAPLLGTARLYSGEATGLIVQLPGWKYPVVIDTATGTMQFDDFGGNWGDRRQLDLYLQRYTVEKAKLEARLKGLPAHEQVMTDGSIKLQIVEHG